MTRHFSEQTFDPEDLFDANTAAQIRRDRERERAEIAKAVQQENEREAARLAGIKQRNDELSKRSNARLRTHEFAAAGVDAPYVDFDGVPTISLSFLLSIGWSIRNVSGMNVLMKPTGTRPEPRETRNNEMGS